MNDKDFERLENRINHVWLAVCQYKEEMEKDAIRRK